MKETITKYSGAILLYLVVIVGVFALNERFKYLNQIEEKGLAYLEVAKGN